MILEYTDFKTLKHVGMGYYLSLMLPDGREVCLESCLNGYCVAIYKDEELILNKTCTDFKDLKSVSIIDGLKVATEIANKKLKEIDEAWEPKK